MENTENPQIQSFIDKYNEWLEARPQSDEVKFVHFSHLIIVLSEQNEDISARNIVHSAVNQVNFTDMTSIHEAMKQQIDKETLKRLMKIKERVESKN